MKLREVIEWSVRWSTPSCTIDEDAPVGDGVLTAAILDQGSLKRVRITPGTDTSIETMLSAATKPR